MQNNSTMFYQKNGLVVIMLSRDLVCLSPGDRMTPIAEYEKRFDFSRWTIQTAIRFLLDNECMELEKRGPKGTFIAKLDYEKLWGYTGWNPLLGVLPVPTSKTHNALLTGLSKSLRKQNVPFNFSFQTPVSSRLESLNRQRCHFVMTSKLAMRVVKEKYPELEVATELNGCLYSMPYRLYYHSDYFRGVEDGMSVAVNDRSIEQSFMTDQVCLGKKVKKVYLPYHESISLFQRKKVDFILQRSDADEYIGMRERSYSLSHLGFDQEIMTPVIVVHRQNYGIAKLIKRNIDAVEIAEIQQKVFSGSMDPAYF